MTRTDRLICPLCGAKLDRTDGGLLCHGARGHNFDAAAAGYINLNMHGPASGDGKEMASARRAFLRRGYYAKLRDRLHTLALTYAPEDARALFCDAGCGEGYYTEAYAADFSLALGVDLSKHALTLAGKSAKAQGIGDRLLYLVGSIYTLPIEDGGCDCIQSVFAPCAADEFFRVLAPRGILVIAAAGEKHLLELKETLYQTVVENGVRRDYPENLTLLHKESLTYRAEIAKEDIYPLFTMTPYVYRTEKDAAARLAVLDELPLTLDFELRVYQKA